MGVCFLVSGEHCAHCSIWSLRRFEVQWELQEWELLSSLLSNWCIIKICTSDHLISTLSSLISTLFCYLEALYVLFYNWAQWRNVLGWTWQQELKMMSNLQGKHFLFREMLTDISCTALGFCASHNALHFSCGWFWAILCSILPYIPHCHVSTAGTGSAVTAPPDTERDSKPPIPASEQPISEATGREGSICHC